MKRNTILLFMFMFIGVLNGMEQNQRNFPLDSLRNAQPDYSEQDYSDITHTDYLEALFGINEQQLMPETAEAPYWSSNNNTTPLTNYFYGQTQQSQPSSFKQCYPTANENNVSTLSPKALIVGISSRTNNRPSKRKASALEQSSSHEQGSNSAENIKLEIPTKRREESKNYFCKVCNENMNKRYQTTHERWHHRKSQHRCDPCKKAYTRKDALDRHDCPFRTVENNDFKKQLPCCKKSPPSQKKSHKRWHENRNSEFRCDDCQTAYPKQYNLDVHKKKICPFQTVENNTSKEPPCCKEETSPRKKKKHIQKVKCIKNHFNIDKLKNY